MRENVTGLYVHVYSLPRYRSLGIVTEHVLRKIHHCAFGKKKNSQRPFLKSSLRFFYHSMFYTMLLFPIVELHILRGKFLNDPFMLSPNIFHFIYTKFLTTIFSLFYDFDPSIFTDYS